MRNLDFIAWDKEEKRYYKVDSIHLPLGKASGKDITVISLNDSEIAEWRSINEIELLQWTGLFDDAGKKIFEKDIVEIHDPSETTTSYISDVWLGYFGAKVYAHPAHVKIGATMHRNLRDYCDYGFGGGIIAKCRIVGNVFQNKDLLKGNKN